jgi:hypothetical protein
VTGDRLIRVATAAVVTAVAAFAAVVSYFHVYDLGRTHGQSGAAARLLPLSVDGLLLAASLVLLHEARNRRDAPWLARLMLWLGIAATLGALVSTWPAVSFVGSVELLMGLVRRARRIPTAAARDAAGEVSASRCPHRRAKCPARAAHPRRPPTPSASAARLAAAAGNPDLEQRGHHDDDAGRQPSYWFPHRILRPGRRICHAPPAADRGPR